MVDEAPDMNKLKAARRKPSAWGTYRLLLAACLVSMIISTLASYFFYHKWSEAEDRASALLAEKNILTSNYNLLKNSFDTQFNSLNVMRDERSKVITLQSSDSTRHYQARVYWNQVTRQCYVDVLSLPPPDSMKEYRLWASGNGVLTNAGPFKMSVEDDIQEMKPVMNADTWMVTLEPKGECTSPTMSSVYLVSGK